MFGAHLTSTSEPEESAPAGGSPYARWGLIGLALVIVLGGGVVAAQAFGGSDAEAISCTPSNTTTVTLTVAPAMADLVDQAVAALDDNDQCIGVDISTASVADVAAAQAQVKEDEEDVFTDLWIPDSPAWQVVLSDSDLTGRVVVPALATSPVGLASGSQVKPPATWLAALKSPQLVKMDPRASGASAITMVAPYSEVAEGIGDAADAQGAIVPVAQKFGAKVAAGQVRPVTVDTIPAGSKRLIPVTEHDYLVARRGNEALTWLTPATGVGVLNFPIVQPAAGEGGLVSSGSVDAAGRTGERIAAWFGTEEGLAAIAEEKLRGADGESLLGDESVTTGTQLPAASRNQVQSTMQSWFSLTVPSSILVAIEDSSAMNAVSGSETRLNVATGAATTALGALPDHARLALWAFSTNMGDSGEDWRELAPYRRLDAPIAEGETQRDLLNAQAAELPALAGGGTGLYDTVLAAYKLANLEYNPAYSNSIAVMTTGVNNDAGSISLDKLIAELEALSDPDRPVRIIAIGIGSDADMEALQQIADVAGNQAFEATTASDVLTVLAQSLLSR